MDDTVVSRLCSLAILAESANVLPCCHLLKPGLSRCSFFATCAENSTVAGMPESVTFQSCNASRLLETGPTRGGIVKPLLPHFVPSHMLEGVPNEV